VAVLAEAGLSDRNRISVELPEVAESACRLQNAAEPASLAVAPMEQIQYPGQPSLALGCFALLERRESLRFSVLGDSQAL
jgi:hypothetical protein